MSWLWLNGSLKPSEAARSHPQTNRKLSETSYNNALALKSHEKILLQAKIEGSKHDFFEKGVANENQNVLWLSFPSSTLVFPLEVKICARHHSLSLLPTVVPTSSTFPQSTNAVSKVTKITREWKAFRQFLLISET